MTIDSLLYLEKTNLFLSYFEYIKLLITLLLVSIIVFVLFLLAYYLAPNLADSEKISAYECGFAPFYDARINLVIHYYMVGLLFILFDIELLFLIPWVLSLSVVNLYGIFTMIFFLIFLILGLILEWNASALDWRRI